MTKQQRQHISDQQLPSMGKPELARGKGSWKQARSCPDDCFVCKNSRQLGGEQSIWIKKLQVELAFGKLTVKRMCVFGSKGIRNRFPITVLRWLWVDLFNAEKTFCRKFLQDIIVSPSFLFWSPSASKVWKMTLIHQKSECYAARVSLWRFRFLSIYYDDVYLLR